MSEEIDFVFIISDAQRAFGECEYEKSLSLYDRATEFAPDSFQAARAIRGSAAASDRLGNHDEAYESAEVAFDIYDGLLKADQALTPQQFNYRELLRERAQTAIVLGGFAAKQGLNVDFNYIQPVANPSGKKAIEWFDKAEMDLAIVEEAEQRRDQYTINRLAKHAVALCVFGGAGGIGQGKDMARQALRVSPFSEAKRDPNSAQLGAKYRYEAKLRAAKKGAAAVYVAHLATPGHSPSRTKATRIARRMF